MRDAVSYPNFRMLASKARMQILSLLLRGPKRTEDIAKALRMNASTTRHHVLLLAQAGFLESSQERDSSGKTQTIYRVRQQIPYVDYPPRQYLDLADALAAYLRPLLGDSVFEEIVIKMGASMGIETVRDLETKFNVTHWDIGSFIRIFVGKYLKSIGSEPDVLEATDDRAVYRVANCRYYETALNHPKVFCDTLEKGFHQGVGQAIGNLEITRRSCMARGDASCEFVIVKTRGLR